MGHSCAILLNTNPVKCPFSKSMPWVYKLTLYHADSTFGLKFILGLYKSQLADLVLLQIGHLTLWKLRLSYSLLLLHVIQSLEIYLKLKGILWKWAAVHYWCHNKGSTDHSAFSDQSLFPFIANHHCVNISSLEISVCGPTANINLLLNENDDLNADTLLLKSRANTY